MKQIMLLKEEESPLGQMERHRRSRSINKFYLTFLDETNFIPG